MYSRCRLLSWLLCLIVISPAFTAETASDLLQQKALANIQAIDRTFDGVLGVYAIDLTDGSVLAYHADIVFPTASSIKVAILIELFRQRQSGKLRLEDPVTLAPSEKVGGSGHLQYQLEKGPVTLTVRELITAMIEDSDNTATNKVISMVGMGQVNTLLDNLELRKTRLQRIMLDGAAAKANRENISTPAELARLMEKIYREQVVTPEACREMIAILKMVEAEMRHAIPGSVEVASKPGNIEGAHCETGIVYLKNRPFAIAVMSSYVGSGVNPVAAVTHEVYTYFERLSKANQYGRSIE